MATALDQPMAATGPAPRTAEITADAEVAGEESAGTARNAAGAPLVLVVGFDGSEAARRALQAAETLLDGRPGWLEVVYVGRRPAHSPISDAGASELDRGYAEMTNRLSLQVRALLEGREQRWHFRRRDGVKYDELVAVADEIRQQADLDSTIVIVVGNSHRVASSVPAALVQHSPYTLVVVP